MHTDRCINKWTDRQTDKQIDRQTGREYKVIEYQTRRKRKEISKSCNCYTDNNNAITKAITNINNLTPAAAHLLHFVLTHSKPHKASPIAQCGIVGARPSRSTPQPCGTPPVWPSWLWSILSGVLRKDRWMPHSVSCFVITCTSSNKFTRGWKRGNEGE